MLGIIIIIWWYICLELIFIETSTAFTFLNSSAGEIRILLSLISDGGEV